jgi:hypothetical protein
MNWCYLFKTVDHLSGQLDSGEFDSVKLQEWTVRQVRNGCLPGIQKKGRIIGELLIISLWVRQVSGLMKLCDR